MLTRATLAVGAGLLAFIAGGQPVSAQQRVPPDARPVGESKRELRAYTRDTLPAGFEEVAGGPESDVRRWEGTPWREPTAFTEAELEAETAQLKQERAVRVAAVTRFEQQLRERERRVPRNPSDREIDDLQYRRALFRYRIGEEHRVIRLINERLEALSRERTGRVEADPATPAAAARDLANARQARAAVDLLVQYDQALEKLLRREPITEEDIIYALSLLNEKAPVATVVSDYFRLLEAEAAERSGEPPPDALKAAPPEAP